MEYLTRERLSELLKDVRIGREPDNKGQDIFTVNQTCHPAGGLAADYLSPVGVLSLYCAKCKQLVIRVRVQTQEDAT